MDGVTSYYNPCKNGIHFCGQTNCNKPQPYTALSLIAENEEQARIMFEALLEVSECTDDEGDYLVDLQQNYDCNEDFWTNRQLVSAGINAAKVALSKAEGFEG